VLGGGLTIKLLAGGGVVIALLALGNCYGPNALELANRDANAAALDGALKELSRSETAAWDADEARRAEAAAAFRRMQPGLEQCLLTEAQASALRVIGN
jgi:hypothetical protein